MLVNSIIRVELSRDCNKQTREYLANEILTESLQLRYQCMAISIS